MVGKKDMCPTCLEKVDLKSMHADHPWEKMGVAWSQLLDLFRYLVVWFPILLVIVEVFFYGERTERPRGLPVVLVAPSRLLPSRSS